MEELSDATPTPRWTQHLCVITRHLQPSDSKGWCATCDLKAQVGQPGYCDPNHKGIDVSSSLLAEL